MATLSGNVSSAKDGAPVENATVVLDKKFALTSESGDYILSGLNPGDYTITVLQRHFEKYQFNMTIPGDIVLDINLVPE